MRRVLTRMMALVLTAASGSALADTGWVGLYRHDITLAQTKFESGQDIKVGWISDQIDALSSIGKPQAHAVLSKSLNGGTNYAAAGLDWKVGSRLYVRPGIGLAINDGPRRAYRKGRRVDLGSPVTFEPELAFGWTFSRHMAIEASWIHLSHATLFSRQNRGMDSWGLRLLVPLG